MSVHRFILAAMLFVAALLGFSADRFYLYKTGGNAPKLAQAVEPSPAPKSGTPAEKPALIRQFPLKNVVASTTDANAKFVADAIFGEFLLRGAVAAADGVDVVCEISVSRFDHDVKASCHSVNFGAGSIAASAEVSGHYSTFQESTDKVAKQITGKFRQQLLAQQSTVQ